MAHPTSPTGFRHDARPATPARRWTPPAQLQGVKGSLAYGAAAAALCAGVYYLLRAYSGYELSLLALGVGHAVGFAVAWGAGTAGVGRRGRWGAVALTFLAIALAQGGSERTSEVELLAWHARHSARSALDTHAPTGVTVQPGVDPCATAAPDAGVDGVIWSEIEGSESAPVDVSARLQARLCAVRRARAQTAVTPGAATAGFVSSVAALRQRAAAALLDFPDDAWLRATLTRPLQELLLGPPFVALVSGALLALALRRAWRVAGAE